MYPPRFGDAQQPKTLPASPSSRLCSSEPVMRYRERRGWMCGDRDDSPRGRGTGAGTTSALADLATLPPRRASPRANAASAPRSEALRADPCPRSRGRRPAADRRVNDSRVAGIAQLGGAGGGSASTSHRNARAARPPARSVRRPANLSLQRTAAVEDHVGHYELVPHQHDAQQIGTEAARRERGDEHVRVEEDPQETSRNTSSSVR